MEHQRAQGMAVIDALDGLGRALDYETSRDYGVGRSSAVDMAWTAALHSDVPLFVFEVESRPSGGMANNALKVLGPSNDRSLKPLFFFHVVLSGRQDNEQISNLRAQWGSHNYRVYRLGEPVEARRLLSDVLLQHRRVSRSLIAHSLADSLRHPVWSAHEAQEVLKEAEKLGFVANYLRDYAMLAQDDPAFVKAYTRRLQALEAMHDDARLLTIDRYGSSGDYIPQLLESAILVNSGAVDDAAGPAMIER